MRIVIADDSALIREGLRLILEDAGHEVVATAGSEPELVAEALRTRPDLTIADIRMPPHHTDEGLRAVKRIRSEWPGAPVLLLSQYVVVSYAEELMASGSQATGYLLKDRVSDIDAFTDAVDRVASGGLVMDPEVVSQVISAQRHTPLDTLTAREREVLELIGQGLTNAAIAEHLVVTDGAVEKHIQRIFAKLGLSADANVHRRVMAVLTLQNG
ncbi:MAG: response regulator transcription factor [Acidipropionibacterium acidipropionici]|jgi:DNA-binding NarL/FixJ family response regulator|uniref:DNA-binding response regulator n=2 Tax=Acidipropionibacterium acidipropionici TaxID=1748 RepID=A0A142KKB2_9ACTN|nr:response regulator transcription factor [Acidipropionibacterium acidipropionici]AFV88809.1 Response regulator containing a CheY-like receiver domain and an HTH DNA-binding domain [Acidipropionibacterium acidipropionici ATCC 4875]ALN16577.1 LuxR family transcriptional regulator [Acidipropionibacterium acidipropionici]AMS06550.1 LuxR family transcriptional regulator [Acidipropionibacterium acidipropionici]AOZ47992.1 DNA-binding response regulator [Acidipropionibacterium acidipropionici]APZ103